MLLVLVLVFAGCEHVQGAVASTGVVPDLDVVMDRTGEFDPCLPSSAVEELDLHATCLRTSTGYLLGITSSSLSARGFQKRDSAKPGSDILALEAPTALPAGLVAPAHHPAPAISLHAHRELFTPTKVCGGVCIVL